MCEEYQQILHGREVWGKMGAGTRLFKFSFSGDNYEFSTQQKDDCAIDGML
jgi:hypothetical protein